jgi:hypothetical protein
LEKILKGGQATILSDFFLAFGIVFERPSVLKLEIIPFAWDILIYNTIEIFKETTRNVSGNTFFNPVVIIASPHDLEGPPSPHD